MGVSHFRLTLNRQGQTAYMINSVASLTVALIALRINLLPIWLIALALEAMFVARSWTLNRERKRLLHSTPFGARVRQVNRQHGLGLGEDVSFTVDYRGTPLRMNVIRSKLRFGFRSLKAGSELVVYLDDNDPTLFVIAADAHWDLTNFRLELSDRKSA